MDFSHFCDVLGQNKQTPREDQDIPRNDTTSSILHGLIRRWGATGCRLAACSALVLPDAAV